MKRYSLINTLMGWVAFAIAAVTYILTTESSASFWDCGEFISTADKLLVGHPPGAPLFMIIARLFCVAAPDVTLIAKMVNIMSALASAFTILFLFWTVTHLARKIVVDKHLESDGSVAAWRTWAVMGAGMVGALAYTFSDTFWFSAVEGEVYAMSSFFTAIVFWAILKWEDVADEPGANRWIVLIAYLMGLSIGVHLLNLLCIPAIALVYYFRKYSPTPRGVVAALLISFVALGAILYGIIPGLVSIAGKFELVFVNSFGLGYNTGAIFWMLLLVAGVVWGLIYTLRRGKRLANTILAAFAVIVLGYSSFAMVVIRSAANPTMDQNSPDNVFALIDYLNREQYGDRPLFYGQTFASPLDRTVDSKANGSPVYVQKDGRYEVADTKPRYKYQAQMLFPRMHSQQATHIAQYKSWSHFKGRQVPVTEADGSRGYATIPTFGENLRFFFAYQVNFMYMRYFMWNFCGRQNDIQGHGELTHGNWLTGIDAIDNMMLGDQSLLSDDLKNNKGHNVYYMLPLLLGLLGMFWHAGKGQAGKQGFWIVMLLFFMTGLAIVLYLNQSPLQPRERDYAYAGSFYAFAIWIGLGVLQLIEWALQIKALQQAKARIAAVAAVSLLSLVAVPGLMAQQNWDDHDRSGCTVARDIAYNYLNSCDENAVIFTNGDNDTFPLWYAQEVEGCRPDVRICNLSYLQTEWYVDQMKRKAYDSDPLPISFTHDQYTHDRDVVYLFDRKGTAINLKDAMDFVRSDDPRSKRMPSVTPDKINYIPGRSFVMPVDKQAAIEAGVTSPANVSRIADSIFFSVPGNYIVKNHLMVLDMLQQSQWRRPLYYAVTVGSDNYCGLTRYFQLEGLSYRIAPIRGSADQLKCGTVDTDKMYHNVMERFRWGFYNNPDVYYDENKLRMASNLRNNLSRLATALIQEADTCRDEQLQAQKRERAAQVLDKIQAELPSSIVPHNFFSLDLAEGYYALAQPDKADQIVEEFAAQNLQMLVYYLNLTPDKLMNCLSEVRHNMAIYYQILDRCHAAGRNQMMEKLQADYKEVEMFATQIFGGGK